MKVFFLGIGGSGMSSLAQYCVDNKIKVTGFDDNISQKTKELEGKGISVLYNQDDCIRHIDNADYIVYTIAFSKNNKLLKHAVSSKKTLLTYGQAVGQITKVRKTIAITGTHGKTTVTGMVAHLMIKNGVNPMVIVGGDYEFLNNNNYYKGDSNYFVLEACEYKNTFLNYDPHLTVVLNMDHDHHDFFETEEEYNQAFKEIAENTISNKGKVITNIGLFNDKYNTFSLPVEKISLSIPGIHNQLNAAAAFKALEVLNIKTKPDDLLDFKLPGRRLELIKEDKKLLVLSDYAHHPTEINAVLQTIKEKYNHKKVLYIFQPHQIDRLLNLKDSFVNTLSNIDDLILQHTYVARASSLNLDTIENEISENLKTNCKNFYYSENFEMTDAILDEIEKDYELIVYMGAGDIDKFARERH